MRSVEFIKVSHHVPRLFDGHIEVSVSTLVFTASEHSVKNHSKDLMRHID